MLDIRPSSEMTSIERDAWDKITAQIVEEMSDDKTTLGELVDRISTVHTGKYGEAILESEFEAFANIIAARVAEVRPGAEQSPSGPFKSSGRQYMGNEPVPHSGSQQTEADIRLDLIIHSERTEHDEDERWDHSLSFGKLNTDPGRDLKDTLLGQMLRLVVSPTLILLSLERETLFFMPFAVSGHAVPTSAGFCKIILYPVGALPSRSAAIFSVSWRPIPLDSVPRLPTTSATRTITSRLLR